jgi:hypothetical protein
MGLIIGGPYYDQMTGEVDLLVGMDLFLGEDLPHLYYLKGLIDCILGLRWRDGLLLDVKNRN